MCSVECCPHEVDFPRNWNEVQIMLRHVFICSTDILIDISNQDDFNVQKIDDLVFFSFWDTELKRINDLMNYSVIRL